MGCSSTGSLQERILSPLQSDVRLGGSVREVLRAHPNHQSIGNGFYLYETAGPESAARIVRLRGEGDTILWLQIQDELIASDLGAEQQRFERETDRLAGILGPAQQRGNQLANSRTARWNDGGHLTVELRLDSDEATGRSRRTLSMARN